jgi:hypothetical protein
MGPGDIIRSEAMKDTNFKEDNPDSLDSGLESDFNELLQRPAGTITLQRPPPALNA